MLACHHAFADGGRVVIKHAELAQQGDAYKLNADLEISLDEHIKEAIDKGVPVEFLYDFTLVKPRTFWFDKEIVTANTRISVSYHALSRQYLVSQSGRQTSHEILREAMIELVQVYDWKVFDSSLIDDELEYKATLNMKLDQTKLPKVIQVEAIGSEGWNLVAEEFEWIPKDLNQ